MAARNNRRFAATVAQWAKQSGREMAAVRGEAAGLLGTALTRGSEFGPGTPVDTGRLLSGWTVEGPGQGRVSLGSRGPAGDPRPNPGGQRARIPRFVERCRAMAVRGPIRIYTEVPYAQYVDGAPLFRNFIRRVRDSWPQIVRTAMVRARLRGGA